MNQRSRPGRSLAAFLRLLWQTSPWLTLLTMLIVPFGQGLLVVQALWVRELVNGVIAQDTGMAVTGAVLLGLTQGLDAILFVPATLIQTTFGERVGIVVNRRIADVASSIPDLSLHEDPGSQDELELLREATAFDNAVRFTARAINTLFSVAVTTVLLALIHPLLVLQLFIAVPGAWVASRTGRVIRDAERRAAVHDRRARHWFDRTTDSALQKELRVFGGQDWAVERMAAEHAAGREIRLAARRRAGALGGVASVLTNGGLALALMFVVYRATQGSGSPGDVVMTVFVLARLTSVVGAMYDLIEPFQATQRAIDRYVWLTDRAAQVDSTRPSPAPSAAPERGLRLEGLRFNYPGNAVEVLKGIDLLIPPGTVFAVVGDNGAGKTTLAKLLSRMYEPTAGRILIDGVDLRAMEHDAWRADVTACYQDFARFELPVREAVGVGSLPHQHDEQRVRAALAEAHASAFVDGLPEGLDTQLGRTWPGGVDLSLGQWQRLSLARAWFRPNPRLVILDEPSASLDAHAEYELFDAARERTRRASSEGQLTMLVSHRFSTVNMADLIVVLDDGRITEIGSHDELMAAGGLYAELYRIQAAGYRDDTSGPA